MTLSSCEATPPHLQQRNVVIGRRFTTSGEGMENNQQPTTTTTPYLWEQLQLHNVVVGRRFTRSGEDMENAQQLRGTTTQYLWEQVSCQTRYITSRLGCQVVQHNRVAKNEPAHSKAYLELGMHKVAATV